ncbi:GNAT family N-acetyltransferase [Tolypothrix sp. PCC 7910]|uniref:GNAT family N-acetyltransferase n=1 Tax=Tolypothrix sp. PCC 7910 TaxID=2099387 RepID=UPI0014278F59|nr:GNAT family N-acetyltransferase [Tolypothrix sp. PCC 7910]QIR40550.1 GNAT family N-acetyltransferase [Tolypothrix sp. PCC 7910]
MKVLLETERLILRQLTAKDADNLFELDSDPEVVRFTTNVGQPTSYTVIQNQILPSYFSYYEKYDNYGCWAAIEKSSQAFIGWFLFRPIVHAAYFNPQLANPNDIELGYRLRKAAWGRGYATEGAKALIAKGFSEFGIQRVLGAALAANLASIRVMEKAGLKLYQKFIYEYNNQEVVIYFIDKENFDYAKYLTA